LFWYVLFKNEFRKKGLRSRLPKRNQKIKVEIEISERNQKNSEFCHKTTSLKKSLEILKYPKRNQKRKSEKKVRNLEMSEKKSENGGGFVLMVHVHSYRRREKKINSC